MADHTLTVLDAAHLHYGTLIDVTVTPFFQVEPYHSIVSGIPTLIVDAQLIPFNAVHDVYSFALIQKFNRKYFYDQYTEEVFLWALVLTHDDLAAPLRFVNDMEDHVIEGETYTGFPFELTLADDTDDELPRARLSIQNVDREIVENIRTLSGPIGVRVSLVLASDPATMLAGPYDFNLTHVRWDALVVEGMLDYEPVLHMSYPGYDHTPTSSPGIFRV